MHSFWKSSNCIEYKGYLFLILIQDYRQITKVKLYDLSNITHRFLINSVPHLAYFTYPHNIEYKW